MKERVTLTIEKEILQQIDRTVDGQKIKNRSHAVELMLSESLEKNMVRTAVILAGGISEKIKPLTNEIPKPMLPVNDKPLLQYNLELLKHYGIRDIIISVGYKAEKIINYFGDGKRYGLNITYVKEDQPLGTAGALIKAAKTLKETFLVCNADELKMIDLHDIYQFHKDNHAVATMALTTSRRPHKYGAVSLQGGRIMRFVEKHEEAPSMMINAGLYIMEPNALDLVPEGAYSLEQEVFPALALDGGLYGYTFTGYWKDISSMEKYEEAISEIKEGSFGF